LLGSSWPCGQGGGLAVVRSPVRTLPPCAYGGALVVWPGMPFPNLDGRIHQSPLFIACFLAARCALIGARRCSLSKRRAAFTSLADSDPGHLEALASRVCQHTGNKPLRQGSRCELIRCDSPMKKTSGILPTWHTCVYTCLNYVYDVYVLCYSTYTSYTWFRHDGYTVIIYFS
jgi:hypothetical protein